MDIKYHRLEIALDPAVRYVSGSVSTWFVPTPGNRNVISFDLSGVEGSRKDEIRGPILNFEVGVSSVHEVGFSVFSVTPW